MDGSLSSGEWLRHVAPGGSGKVRVRLSPDYGIDLPVEVEVVAGPRFRASSALVGLQEGDVVGIFGYVDAEMLGISSALERDLKAFQQWWADHVDLESEPSDEDEADDSELDLEWRRWQDEGRDLGARLHEELGPRYDISLPGEETL